MEGARKNRKEKKKKKRSTAFTSLSLSFSVFFQKTTTTMPPHLLSSSTPTAAAGPSSSFLPADRRAARRGLWRDWASAPEQGSLFAVGDRRSGGDGRGGSGSGSSAAAAVSEWATAWLAASTADSDLTSMLHNEVMVRGRGLGVNEAAVRRGEKKI